MILTDYFRSSHDMTWNYAKQCGVEHGVIRLPEEGYTGETTASAIRFNENHIYVSNRGLDTISVLKNQNGKFVYKDTYSCSGNFPGDFDIIGNYIICTNEKSNSITVLDKQNFNLMHVENNIKLPICVISRDI